jgi:predicted nucleic acid-binding protein
MAKRKVKIFLDSNVIISGLISDKAEQKRSWSEIDSFLAFIIPSLPKPAGISKDF